MLIVNADDWGRCVADTDAARAVLAAGVVTSATAMVYMADSTRAAAQALELDLPVGLHINLTEPFSADHTPDSLKDEHEAIATFLNRHRLSQLAYNPLLHTAFVRVVEAQLEEFKRLFGKEPSHFDGHEHMHLCANVLVSRPIPKGSRMRRTFSYSAGEKGVVNRAFRALVSHWMRRHYVQTDYFFDLSERMAPSEFQGVCALARYSNVELMCHPANDSNRDFLLSGRFEAGIKGLRLGSYHDLPCLSP